MKKFALISVSDKTGIVEFAKNLASLNFEILATGNTAKVIIENNIPCTEISNFTSFPEIFSGRVKTLQPKIFGGILMRRDIENDLKEAKENGIMPIDIVCVNLYPFPKVVDREDIDLVTKIENIDIGGPSLIRAAAKNYKFISILTKPEQYSDFISELQTGEISIHTKEKLASEAFSYTSYYDTLIANFLEKTFDQPKEAIRLNYKLTQSLRYGENPHQQASLFGEFDNYFEILHGKEISYNNIIDLVASVEIIQDLPENSCVIVKHTNPCGAGTSVNVLDAFNKAFSGDPVSAYGGIVSFNSVVDETLAAKLNEIFLEIICAPDFTKEALDLLFTKKNRRIVKVLKSLPHDEMMFKNIPGGLIAQGKDNSKIGENDLTIVTKNNPTKKEIEDLLFAWILCKHTKSNAIVYVKDQKVLGVGAGQMSRVDSAKIGAMKAKEFGHDLTGAVAASDAFFPFADGLVEIANNGVTAVIQPGGSVRDSEVIQAANERNLSMVFTGIRNFKH
ncbi:MAG: bifunctional phosphoribosylaminoimidazolecarboxamide formyltransferase/IMP cyclohydrolase [Ignavibacteriales bacterium]|nr:bifunctional phosphoribosylaminoimidazolecarboxamide formyltransferase/IMP cyclohydrolase [Ignavibacteriales bacterium]